MMMMIFIVIFCPEYFVAEKMKLFYSSSSSIETDKLDIDLLMCSYVYEYEIFKRIIFEFKLRICGFELFVYG